MSFSTKRPESQRDNYPVLLLKSFLKKKKKPIETPQPQNDDELSTRGEEMENNFRKTHH